MAFSESFLTELVERNDIVDVVSGYVRLSKKSGSNIFGLCPFHSEKTPSFSVSPDKQMYHCFGCGKGGGVINFIMEIENLGFRDAVEFLARRAGMQMPEEENGWLILTCQNIYFCYTSPMNKNLVWWQWWWDLR